MCIQMGWVSNWTLRNIEIVTSSANMGWVSNWILRNKNAMQYNNITRTGLGQ